MNIDDAPTLPDVRRTSGERRTLEEMLSHYRVVMLRKTWGLTDEQLGAAVAPSDLTLAGILHHLAWVEDWGAVEVLSGLDPVEPWASADWDSDSDWEFTTGATLTHDELAERFTTAVGRAEDTYAPLELETVSENTFRGEKVNLRWILVHLIEEYARHVGHADYLRQAIDQQTGN